MKRLLLLLPVILISTVIVYPTAFDKRPDLYAYTKWAADSFGLRLHYHF